MRKVEPILWETAGLGSRSSANEGSHRFSITSSNISKLLRHLYPLVCGNDIKSECFEISCTLVFLTVLIMRS